MDRNILHIICFTIILFSCKTDLENTDYQKLNQSENLNDYESFLNNYPNSQYFKNVLYRYDTLKNFSQLDIEYGMYLHSLGSSRNALDIFVIKDSLPCINDSITTSNLIYNQYSHFFDEDWENTFGVPTRYDTIVIMGETKKYSRGIIRISYNTIQAADSVQKVAIVCDKIVYNYKNNLALDWFNNPLSELSIEIKHIIDSLFYNRISFTNIKAIPSCYDKNPPAPKVSQKFNVPLLIIKEDTLLFEDENLEIINE